MYSLVPMYRYVHVYHLVSADTYVRMYIRMYSLVCTDMYLCTVMLYIQLYNMYRTVIWGTLSQHESCVHVCYDFLSSTGSASEGPC